MTKCTLPTIKSQGRGRSNSLPTPVVEYLKTWLMDHMHHPYPTDQEKAEMMLKTGIDVKRLNNWFVNNRIRYWKPRMEAMQRQQHQRKDSTMSSLPLPGPYSRLVSPLHQDIRPSPVLKLTDFSQQASSMQLVRSTESVVAPTTTVIKITTRATGPSPSIVSDASVYDEGEWSDGGSVRSKEEIASPPLPQLFNSVTPSPKVSRKRTLPEVQVLSQYPSSTIVPVSSRTKVSRKDDILWRDACVSSQQVNDSTLPTLDEAALLFGFATSN